MTRTPKAKGGGGRDGAIPPRPAHRMAIRLARLARRARGPGARGGAALAARVERLEDENWSLRDAAERYRSVLEVSGDVVLRCDADRRIVFVNDGFSTTFGLPAARVLGRRLDRLVAGLVVPGGEAARADESEPGAGDLLLSTPAGPRWFSLREVPLAARDGDRATRQCMLRDVTDRRATETELRRARDLAEAANAAKSRFLALASHEIRTPLNGILGMADLLLQTPLSSEQQTYAAAVRTSGEALLSLVDDVLDLAKIEAGRLDLQPGPHALETEIESVVELIAPRAQAKGIELAAYSGPGLPARMVFDAVRLRQVLINLVGNAIKFTETGGVSLSVTRAGGAENAADGDAGAVRLSFTVTDTGIGIAAADLDRIFGEYEQADSGPARRFGGTGLGLAIARAIVRRMGGDIAVASSPGAGSAFSFEVAFPVAAAERSGPERRRAPRERLLAGRRVLVVSAGRIEAPLILRRLSDLGAEARLVGPADAPGAASAARADAVLVDHGPAADAEPLLAGLAGLAPAAVLIAPSDRGSLARLKAAGAVGYLVKPVRRRSLERVAAALVEGRPVASDATDVRVPGEPTLPGGRSLRLLVADDNPINALLARALLANLGHAAETVGDGAVAVDTVEAALSAGRPFDAVLMDLHMPTLDGYGAIRAIRAAEAAAGRARLPIVALTADTTPDTERAALDAGADARLVKPMDAGAVSAVLDQLTAPAAGRRRA
ncbi:ATP-binding protein [Prosthecomicrobium sp. N25]|uniref:ATP-binding protein n=1 Tax=Prosthecomicrobium sp. N25 TaxID=3129254 RepID=UPI0030769E90